MANQLKKLCVFCGSSPGKSEIYMEKVKLLGNEFASQNIALVYGGGNVGLMGEISRAVLEDGGNVTGVIPKKIYENVEHVELTELFVVDTMHERKAKMYEIADGFIAMPGGVGTLEELAEVITWYQLGYHNKPVGLYNIDGYYEGLLDLFEHMIEEGFMKRQNIQSIIVDDDPVQLLRKMENVQVQNIDKYKDRFTDKL
ncbi:TIGR00730 family Rossman fold protein [Pseudalkalibacillus caeni]|uniref:Cytokinin riboside 5'-monophosphate phosphoribohydrolase n=1 Tax=Exobacillus caeni TaxID=2574798 RepID=A0A5R9F6H6_9BACL|nr:TIGR00730 family Rossman fold protein [Pseudalkalibacillus caeni]TLS36084.1 TIGR00730 family Rossman fold protein [Pseudalkalibacillus caeni]